MRNQNWEPRIRPTWTPALVAIDETGVSEIEVSLADEATTGSGIKLHRRLSHPLMSDRTAEMPNARREESWRGA